MPSFINAPQPDFILRERFLDKFNCNPYLDFYIMVETPSEDFKFSMGLPKNKEDMLKEDEYEIILKLLKKRASEIQ